LGDGSRRGRNVAYRAHCTPVRAQVVKALLTALLVVYPSGRLSSMMGSCRRPLQTPQRDPPAESNLMQAFRTLEHTADVGFEAFGATRDEAFANAGRALMDLIMDLGTINPRAEVTLEIHGADPQSLLVNWLSEILFLHDAQGWVFRDFEILSLHDDSLIALARGEKFQKPRHQAKLLVKAITYHQLALEKTAQGWRAQVYVDI
jgi:protein archease